MSKTDEDDEIRRLLEKILPGDGVISHYAVVAERVGEQRALWTTWSEGTTPWHARGMLAEAADRAAGHGDWSKYDEDEEA